MEGLLTETPGPRLAGFPWESSVVLVDFLHRQAACTALLPLQGLQQEASGLGLLMDTLQKASNGNPQQCTPRPVGLLVLSSPRALAPT